MTILPPSGSDGSSSFALLHDRVRRWIWDQQWSELRDVQELAIRTILTPDGKSADGDGSRQDRSGVPADLLDARQR